MHVCHMTDPAVGAVRQYRVQLQVLMRTQSHVNSHRAWHVQHMPCVLSGIKLKLDFAPGHVSHSHKKNKQAGRAWGGGAALNKQSGYDHTSMSMFSSLPSRGPAC